MPYRHRTPWKVAVLSLGLLLAAAPLLAYAEDVCYFRVRGTDGTIDPEHVYYYPFNCYDLECLDGPEATAGAARCTIAGLMQYLGVTMASGEEGSSPLQGHSSLHFDALWVLARVAGLGETDALDLASHAESVDVGVYRPTATAPTGGAQPFVATLDAGTQATSLDGLVRTNAETDGFGFHFVPFYSDGAMSHHTVSVAQYKAFLTNRSATTFDEIEQPLVHVRDWAFATGGARPLCKFGRTAADGSCASGAMYVWAMLLGDAVYQEGVLDLGWQEIHLAEGGYSASDGPALSGTPAALGIYLHVLGDRLSHGLCLDDSPIRPASGSAATCNGTQVYELELRFDGACGQVTHAVRHYLETGHGTATPARSITGLNLSARELAEWSRLHQLTAAAPRPTYPAFFVNGKLNEEFVRRMIGTASAPGRLVQAIGESCANRRLAKLCALARDGYGIEWYDGNATCTFPTFPGDRTCPAKADG